MKRKLMRVRPAALPAFLLAGLIALATGSLPAFAATYTLRAEATMVTLPGNTTVPMWGFALVSYDLGAGLVTVNGPATVPGPRLTVPAGQGLTVHLLNTLPSPVSLYIPGQAPPLAVGATEPQVTRNGQGRIQSFVHETPGGLPGAPSGPVTYIWNSIQPGTYLYHSGTHPAVQVQMGLYGAMLNNAVEATPTTPAEAYPGQPYDAQAMLLYSEIDPLMHETVAEGNYGTDLYPSTVNYQPKFFLVNGNAADPTAPLLTVDTGKRVLLRFLNAGLKEHTPSLLDQHLTVLAEGGHAYRWPRQHLSPLLPPGGTLDALVSLSTAGSHPLFDRRLFRSNQAAVQGPMLAYLSALPVLPPLPAAPVLTTATPASTQVSLGWSLPAGPLSGFRIERTLVATAETTLIELANPAATSYIDTPLQPETAYSYVVYAYNAAGQSPASNALAATTLMALPAAPTLDTATPTSTQVTLGWTPAAGPLSGFRIERTLVATAETTLIELANPAATSYIDTPLQPSTAYRYVVYAYNAAGQSPASNALEATTLIALPAAPVLNSAAPAINQVVLGWTPPAGTLSGFRIERTLVATAATVVLELPDPAATGYTDTPLQPATAYRYVVYAYNAAGQSPASNALEATTFPSVAPPNAPTNASASITEQGGTWFVSLRWRDRSFNEEGYFVERSVNQADWTRIADLPGSVTTRYATYDDLTAAAGTTYYYRVQSYRGGGSAVSGWSNTASVATPGGATPQAPANLAATFIGYTYVTLAWEDTSNNETAFILERSLDEFATVAQTYTLPANSTSINVYNIARATMHYFRIKARNVDVDSAWSDIIDVRTRGN